MPSQICSNNIDCFEWYMSYHAFFVESNGKNCQKIPEKIIAIPIFSTLIFNVIPTTFRTILCMLNSKIKNTKFRYL